MGFNCGIVGLPNVGKSTIFNALTSGKAEASNYPFCTINPNVGIVKVPDEQLEKIAEITHPEKTTFTTLEILDIAGLVEGASQGEGLGNQFLGHIRNVDVIAHVIRCFENPDVSRISGSIEPGRDIDIVNTELILADLDTIDKRIAKAEKLLKTGDKKIRNILETYRKVRSGLDGGKPARTLQLGEHEKHALSDLNLLTLKPVFYVANVDEEQLDGNECTESIKDIAEKEGAHTVVICGDMESEIAQLEEEERGIFLKDMGLDRSGLETLIEVGYHLLRLVTFYTTVGTELRAWTIREGTEVKKAAGKIHSDMEKGFIKAEVVSYDDFVEAATMIKAREKGYVHLEGKEYVVQDGDIVHIRFNASN